MLTYTTQNFTGVLTPVSVTAAKHFARAVGGNWHESRSVRDIQNSDSTLKKMRSSIFLSQFSHGHWRDELDDGLACAAQRRNHNVRNRALVPRKGLHSHRFSAPSTATEHWLPAVAEMYGFATRTNTLARAVEVPTSQAGWKAEATTGRM